MTKPINLWTAHAGPDTQGRLVVQPNSEMVRLSRRHRIFGLQHVMQQAVADGALAEAECPLQHVHIDGVYVRTIFIPAGTVIVGKIHKHSHANILSKGRVTVVTEDGGIEHLEGPLTMKSPAGCKRAVYAHTDTTWTTIHATGETDLAKIEDYVIAPDYATYEAFMNEFQPQARLQ